MREPEAGKENPGAVIGAVTGAVGGLFAVVLPYVIMTGNIKALAAYRQLGVIGFLVSVPIGWFAGGYISQALEKKFGYKKAGIIGGLLGGMVPVTGFAIWGWYLVTH